MAPTDVTQRRSQEGKKMLSIKTPVSVGVYNQHMAEGSRGSGCGNFPPQMQQTMEHDTVLPLVGCGHGHRTSGLDRKDLLHSTASVGRALLNAGSTKIRFRGRPRAAQRPGLPRRSGLAMGTTGPNLSKPRMQTGAPRKTKYIWVLLQFSHSEAP